jgi:hypothetical protein
MPFLKDSKSQLKHVGMFYMQKKVQLLDDNLSCLDILASVTENKNDSWFKTFAVS